HLAFATLFGSDGVKDAGVRQRRREGEVVLTDDFQVQDEAGAFVAAAAEKFADAVGHSSVSFSFQAPGVGCHLKCAARASPVTSLRPLSPVKMPAFKCAVAWIGGAPHRAPGKE